MTRLREAWPLAMLAMVALLLSASPATAGDQETVKHKKIEIKRYVHEDCEGDDCDEKVKHRRVIVIGDDGEVREIEGEGMDWVGHHGVHAFSMPHHGRGGFLGVATTELTPELRAHFGVPEAAGVLVARVVDDSAAAAAGVRVGDILTAVGEQSIDSTGDLIRAVRGLEPGTAVDLELWRDGSLQTLGATLGERQGARRHAMVMRCDDEEEDCPEIGALFMHCDDEGEDCPEIAALGDFGCGDDSPCEIEVECDDAGCECAVNGQAAECETLPGFAAPGE